MNLLARYRALDDQITSTLNRTLASSRDAGRNLPPSLLLPSSLPLLPSSSSSSSSHSPLLQSHADAGTTTYARADSASCAALWDQLVRVWSGREESVRYCLSITGAPPTRVATQGAAPSFSPADEEDDELARLDADRRLGSGGVADGRRARKTQDRDAERAPDRWTGADEETWRGTREAEEDALVSGTYFLKRIRAKGGSSFPLNLFPPPPPPLKLAATTHREDNCTTSSSSTKSYEDDLQKVSS
ncbi:hypothetical protein OC845_005024 [Tilletia horrida]|nr:hypothetical protein OC845_005024 [Tilletia horrida]